MDDLVYQLEELQREHRALLRSNIILQRQKNRAVGICFELKQFWQQRETHNDMKRASATLIYDDEGKESSEDISEYSDPTVHNEHEEASVNVDLGEDKSQNSASEFSNILQENDESLPEKKNEKYYDQQAKLKRKQRFEKAKTEKQVRAQSRIGLEDLERACMLQEEKRKYRGRPRPKKIVNTKGKPKHESKDKKKQAKAKNIKPYYRKRNIPKKNNDPRRRNSLMRNNKQQLDRLGISPYQFPWYPDLSSRPGYNNYRYPTNIQYYPHIYDRNYIARYGRSHIIRPNINSVRRPRPTRSNSSKIKPRVRPASVGKNYSSNRSKRGGNARRSTKITKSYSKTRRNIASGNPSHRRSTQWTPP